MPAINVAISSGADDGFWRNPPTFVGFLNNSHPEAVAWTFAESDNYRNRGYLRFTNVNIPQGADVYTAAITVRCIFPTVGGTGDAFTVFGWDIDDAFAIVESADADVMLGNHTAATKNTDPTWANGQNYEIDVANILQEIVNRPGWVSGNAVCFFFQTNVKGSEVGRYIASYETGHGATLESEFDSYEVSCSMTAKATMSVVSKVTEASPLLNDLVAYYPLDETNGAAIDVHGDYDLTDAGAVGTAAGKISTSRDFNPVDPEDVLTSSDDVFSPDTSSFTLSTWVYLRSAGFGDQYLVSKSDTVSNVEYAIWYDGSRFKFGTSVSGASWDGEITAATPNPVVLNTWYHIIAWRHSDANGGSGEDGGGGTIHISVNDATPSTQVFQYDQVLPGTADFRLGGADGAYYADARVDETGYWLRELTSGERTALYNAGAGLAYPFGGITHKAFVSLAATATLTPTPVVHRRLASCSMTATATTTVASRVTKHISCSMTATAKILSANPRSGMHFKLVGCYPCNEASGNLTDVSVSAYSLTDTNTVTATTSGLLSGARVYTAASSERFIRTAAGTDPFAMGDIDFTISMWIKATTKPTSMFGFAKWGGAGAQEFVVFYDSLTDRFVWVVRNAANTANGQIYSTVTSTTIGQWYYVQVWHDSVNNLLGISVNGTETTASYSAGVSSGLTGTTTVGSSSDGLGYLNGQTDEILVHKRVLTATERSRLYNGGLGKAYPFDYEYGRLTMTAAATVAATPSVIKPISASLTASATVSPVVVRSFFRRSASLTATATMTADSRAGTRASLTASATVTASAWQGYRTSASLTGRVLITADAEKQWQRSANLTAAATLTAAAKKHHLASAALTGSALASIGTRVDYLSSTSLTASATTAVTVRKIIPISCSMTATANVTAANSLVKNVSCSMVGTASGSASAVRSLLGSSTMTAAATMTAANRLYKPLSCSMTSSASVTAAVKKRIAIEVGLIGSATASVTTRRDLKLSKNLIGRATLSAAATRRMEVSASLTGSASLTASGLRDLTASSSMTATAVTGVLVRVNKPVSASLAGTASLSAVATRNVPVSSSIVGSAILSASGIQSHLGQAGLTGAAILSASGLQSHLGRANLTATATLSANYWQHVGEGFLEYLLATDAVTDLVDDRIYPGAWPMEEGSPAIVYTFGQTRHGQTLRRPDGVAEADLTVSIFSRSIDERDEIAGAVHEALVDYSGLWGAVSIRQVYSDGEGDGAEVEDHYFTQRDYVVVYDESRPLNATDAFNGDANLEDSLIEFLSDLAPTYPQWIEREEVSGNVIRYRRTNNNRGRVLGGENGDETITIDISVRSRRLNEVYRLSNTLRNRLDGYVGTIETTGILAAKMASETDALTRIADGSEIPYYEVRQSYIFAIKRIS